MDFPIVFFFEFSLFPRPRLSGTTPPGGQGDRNPCRARQHGAGTDQGVGAWPCFDPGPKAPRGSGRPDGPGWRDGICSTKQMMMDTLW